MEKTITKFKIWPRNAHDYIEIWPFDTYNQALKVCRESWYDDKIIRSFDVYYANYWACVWDVSKCLNID
jgi:hypothetical protein